MDINPIVALVSFAGALAIGIGAIGLYIKIHYH